MVSLYVSKFTDENNVVANLLQRMELAAPDYGRIDQQARVFIETIRKNKGDLKGFNALMQSYDLTSDEGLALMMLAEALLRIPDAATANLMIQDKLSEGDWADLFENATDLTAKLSGYGLSLSQSVMDSMIGRLGMPIIRRACIEAMQMMGRTFVLGRDVEEAIKNAKPSIDKGYIYNFDMLGEGARTSQDATYYFKAYKHAITQIGLAYGDQNITTLNRAGVSIKLSALYPRYDYLQRDKAVKILSDKLAELCHLAAENHLNLTVDAEEADRLEISLEIIEAVLKQGVCANWDGFGLAVQAYHKSSISVIEEILKWTDMYACKLCVRLVKGAYWDSEIKHAQVEGHTGYPVFTRKENTDVSYMACAKLLLDNRDRIHPMFGTHNAHTAAAVIDMAGDDKHGFIFQCLHGMGESLHNEILLMDHPVCVYAPVGTHKYLLAYLVRRLLENGANSSFVNKVYDDRTSIDDLIRNPIAVATLHTNHCHPKIPLPCDIYSNRRNSVGYDLSQSKTERDFHTSIDRFMDQTYQGGSLIAGKIIEGATPPPVLNLNPANNHDEIGFLYPADSQLIEKSFDVLKDGFYKWNGTDVEIRAKALENLADLYEANTHEMIAILIREAGKTIADAVNEIREAVDFCRYYALQARILFQPELLEGPTGEDNILLVEGRGIYVCVSPWNFPLAIFTGQIAAALVCGNAVIAKPAEQTPAIAAYAVQLMMQAGIPSDAIALLQGDGTVGASIINHVDVAGVCFTGSTQVAKTVQRALAAKDGAIVPFIAETGGLNAMVVDSTALPEQVTDDVLLSAFGSAGQRCSALRLLCVQDDIAADVIDMIRGGMDHLNVGDPVHLSTDVGPIIDADALGNLNFHLEKMQDKMVQIYQAPMDDRLMNYGTYTPPVMMELQSIDDLSVEAFGPILHIIRYKESELGDLIKSINAKGYGLTFGLHSRIQKRHVQLTQQMKVGNIYINRGQTGAVVGVQPFGGCGLSGTGPKAGGPHYLNAFITEKSISDNITASGGNATLVNL